MYRYIANIILPFLGICGMAHAQVTANTPAIGLNPINDQFTYDSKQVAYYGLGWYSDTWFNYGPTAFLSGYGGIKFFALGNLAMSIDYNGQMGIGTQNTQGYKLAVNGNIRAKEVKVETANWPDYVFGDDYKLPDLAELSNYIKQHRHLPGMPGAREAEAEGIALGEMNRLLLEKVEELTLLLIEREKAVQKEKQVNERQEDRIKILESLMDIK